VKTLVDAVAKSLSDESDFIPLHEPRMGNLEKQFVSSCVESTFVSSVGEYVDQFETEIAEYTGAKRAIAVVNGTAALHVSLLLAGVQKDDEVLVPGLTFAATANAVAYTGAVPHFVDAEEETLGICPIALDAYMSEFCEVGDQGCLNKKTGRKISAMVPVHIFGHPCKIEELIEVARKYKVKVVEDAAESLGSFYKGRHTGTFGMLGTVSFNGNKIITTGGGGAILTNDDDLANQAKHLTTTAKVPHRWEYVHDQVGYNYRMPNLNAAFGCAQLKKLPEFLESKKKLFEVYQENFSGISAVRLLQAPPQCTSNYWLQTILLEGTEQRDDVLAALNEAGYMSRPVWTGLHKLKPFEKCPRMEMKVTDMLEKRIINLPSSAFLCD